MNCHPFYHNYFLVSYLFIEARHASCFKFDRNPTDFSYTLSATQGPLFLRRPLNLCVCSSRLFPTQLFYSLGLEHIH